MKDNIEYTGIMTSAVGRGLCAGLPLMTAGAVRFVRENRPATHSSVSFPTWLLEAKLEEPT